MVVGIAKKYDVSAFTRQLGIFVNADVQIFYGEWGYKNYFDSSAPITDFSYASGPCSHTIERSDLKEKRIQSLCSPPLKLQFDELRWEARKFSLWLFWRTSEKICSCHPAEFQPFWQQVSAFAWLILLRTPVAFWSYFQKGRSSCLKKA